MTEAERYRKICDMVGDHDIDTRPRANLVQSLRRYGMSKKDALLVLATIARVDRALNAELAKGKDLPDLVYVMNSLQLNLGRLTND